MKKYLFDNDKEKFEILKKELNSYARINRLNYDEMPSEDGLGWMCQISYKQSSKIPSMNDTATTIIFREMSEETLELEMGKGKWGMKAWAATAGVIAMGPLSFVFIPWAAIGAKKQQKQNKDLLELIRRKLSLKEI